MAETHRHWSRIAESGTVLGMRVLFVIYRFFGRAGFRLVLYPVMTYYYLTRPIARQASRQYLKRLQQHCASVQENASFKHFLTFGEILLDKLLVWLGHIKLTDITFKSDGHFETAMQKKQGGIIVVSHLGNTEVSNALAHQQPDLKLTLLVFTQHAEKFNALMKRVDDQQHIEMYQVTDMSPVFAMLMAERVAAGEYLVIAGDRTPVTGDDRVSFVDFMGHQAAFPQGAFILASLLKCPVFLMFCLKHENFYHIYLERFSEQIKSTRSTRTETLNKIVQRYASRLEFYCAKAPLQWFNFYPFWEKAKPELAKDVRSVSETD